MVVHSVLCNSLAYYLNYVCHLNPRLVLVNLCGDRRSMPELAVPTPLSTGFEWWPEGSHQEGGPYVGMPLAPSCRRSVNFGGAGVLILQWNCARRAEPSDSLPELGAQSAMPWQTTDPARHGERHCDEPSEFFEE